MSLERDLLARICADPANDELRLVYADKLLERGDPRGTFIAEQCELARLDVLSPRYPSLLASTRRLQVAHVDSWLADLPVDLLNPQFSKGFVARATFQPDEVVEGWKQLSAREPVDGLELIVHEALRPEERGLTNAPNPRVLKVLPEGWVTDHSVGDVLAWGMPRLKNLDLSGCSLGATGAALLTNGETDLAETFDDWKAPPPFARGQLERLVLHGCGLHDQGAVVLFTSEILSGLRALDISQCVLTDKATLAALRDSVHLAGLTSLSLAGNNALRDELGGLAGWSALPKLERFGLPQVITAAELAALFPKPSSRLRALELNSAKTLAKTPDSVARCAEALTELDLGTSSLGDDGWEQLVASPCMESLLELHLNGCSLSDEAIGVLTKSKLRRLVTLDLSSNKLTDEGLEALADWAGLEHVTHLRVGNNRKLTAAGFEALMAAEQFVPSRFEVGKVKDPALVKKLRGRYGVALQVG